MNDVYRTIAGAPESLISTQREPAAAIEAQAAARLASTGVQNEPG